jgi:hypothetical protein
MEQNYGGFMRISPRMASLLEKAATCFEDGANPFRHHEWLSDNAVTLNECEQLSELIGAVLHGFVNSAEKPPIEDLRPGYR